MAVRVYGLTLMVAVLASACDKSAEVMPTAATPLATTNPGPGAITGEIRIGSVTPPSGSALPVRDCGPSWTGLPGRHLCNDDWHGAFEIVVDRDLTDIVLTVWFDQGDARCGEIFVPGQSFAAGQRHVVSASSPLYLTFEPEGYQDARVVQRCAMPSSVDRLVVQLWQRDRPAAPLLVQEFNYTYSLVAEGRIEP